MKQTRNKAELAPLLLGSVLIALLTSERKAGARPATTPTLPEPAPSNLPPPTVPSVPTEPPRPRGHADEIRFAGLQRYEITADVLPVDGVSLTTVAKRALDHLHFDDGELRNYKTVERSEVGKVTRLTFRATSISSSTIAIGRQYSIGGVGSVWLVSAKRID